MNKISERLDSAVQKYGDGNNGSSGDADTLATVGDVQRVVRQEIQAKPQAKAEATTQDESTDAMTQIREALIETYGDDIQAINEFAATKLKGDAAFQAMGNPFARARYAEKKMLASKSQVSNKERAAKLKKMPGASGQGKGGSSGNNSGGDSPMEGFSELGQALGRIQRKLGQSSLAR